MKTVIATAGLIVAGVLTWQIGGRLSMDAVGMGVGLVFGVLAGFPAALLVLATSRRAWSDESEEEDYAPRLVGGYEAGYRAGVRDTTDMARGLARQLPEHRPTVIVEQPADDDFDDDVDVEAYTPAYPFGRRQFRITGEVEPTAANRCANWELCPNCHWPITPDENCPVDCGFPAPDAAAQRLVAAAVQLAGMQGSRQFRITGEVEE